MNDLTNEKKGFYVRKRPREYPMTPQQKKLKEVLDECGVHKGISKKDLQIKMVECIGPKMREIKK
jgi:hypothetical protein